MSSVGSCFSTVYTTKGGYNTCNNAVLNMGCDYNSFEGVDSYGKCMFTCHLPPVGRSMGGGGQGRGKMVGGGIGGVGVLVRSASNNTGLNG